MRREILAFLMLTMITAAALDQSYVHTITRDGNSTIGKTAEIVILSGQVAEEVVPKLDTFCQASKTVDCSVERAAGKITIREQFPKGSYYSYSIEYGLPFVTYTAIITRIPTERFAYDLERVLIETDAIAPGQEGAYVAPIGLTDKEGNAESVAVLKQFNAVATYTINMPAGISEAYAGNVKGKINGTSATFNLVDVLAESKPITIKSSELNFIYIVGIVGVVVLAALSLTFFGSTRMRRRKR